MSSTCTNGSKCFFPDGDWGDEYRGQGDAVTVYLPPDWRAILKLDSPPWAETAKECAELERMVHLRTPAKRAEIIRQASGYDIDDVWSVQMVAGDPDKPVRPAAKAAVRALLDDVWAPMFFFKTVYKRGRPFMCCAQELDPMFKPGEPFYPAHPAYPSGHSTQAHALAYFYARLLPHRRDALMDAAGAIALNREIAGLHYPSDSRAGKQLAEQVVDLIFQSPEFNAMAEEAKREYEAPAP